MTKSISCDEPPIILLLKRQAALFDQLAKLSDQQTGLIGTGPSEPLLSLLAKRQRYIDELTHLSTELEPYRANWEQTRSKLDQDQTSLADELVERSHALLDSILDQDSRDQRALQLIQDQLGGELAKISQVGRARQAYMVRAPDLGNRFTNRQG